MIYEIREIELLRIIAACKDIPVGLDYIAPFTDDYVKYMGVYAKRTKCKLSYRLTEHGYELLEEKGYKYKQDKYPVGISRTMDKRLENARVMICMYLAGVDVFGRTAPYYISSASIRQSRGYGSVMGSSTLIGTIFAKDVTYGILWASEDINYNLEIETAKKLIIKYGGNHNIQFILFAHKYEDFNAINVLDSGATFLVTSDMFGVKQLRIITSKNYSDEFSYKFLNKGYIICQEVNLEKLLKYFETTEEPKVIEFNNQKLIKLNLPKRHNTFAYDGDIALFKFLGLETETHIPSEEYHA